MTKQYFNVVDGPGSAKTNYILLHSLLYMNASYFMI